MGVFLGAAGIIFLLCWIWVGGYIADLAIWIVSKVLPRNADETAVSIGIGVVATIVAILVAVTTHGADAQTGPAIGGFILGVGLYVAVRLPSRTRASRTKAAAKVASATASPAAAASTPLQCAQCGALLRASTVCTRCGTSAA